MNWMIAGRGIVHSERTPDDLRSAVRPSHGLQMWAALPVKAEEAELSFSHTPEEAISVLEVGGTGLRVLVNSAFITTSPVPVGAEPVRPPASGLQRYQPWLVGNLYPFLWAAALLPGDQVALVAERALATLQPTARHAEGGASWIPGINRQCPANWLQPVQDCHGAPGIFWGLAAAPHAPEWDALLLQAGAPT